MGPTNNLIYLVQHVSAMVSKQADQVLQEQLGIGLSQYKILSVMEWSPQLQQQAIAQNLGQTEASISRQMHVLEGKGLIQIMFDPKNKRTRTAVPTLLGMQQTEAATAILRRSFGPEFTKLGDKQLNQLVDGLKDLHSILCRPGRLGACDHALGL